MRKTPAQSRSKDLVDSVLQAAARVFRGREYEDSTTNEIASIAGVSIGSLYQYFPNKGALIGALIEFEAKRLRSRMHREIENASGQPIEKKIELILNVVMDTFVKDRSYLRKLFVLAPSLERLGVMVKTRRLSIVQIRKILEAEEFPGKEKHDLDALAFAIVNAVMGSVDFFILSSGEKLEDPLPDPEAVFREVRALVLALFKPNS